MSKLEFEIVHFLVILVLLLLNVGGCGCQPLNSKFILKVKSQMANPNEHIHGPFLTQMTVLVENLGLQSITNQYGRPCIYLARTAENDEDACIRLPDRIRFSRSTAAAARLHFLLLLRIHHC